MRGSENIATELHEIEEGQEDEEETTMAIKQTRRPGH